MHDVDESTKTSSPFQSGTMILPNIDKAVRHAPQLLSIASSENL